MEEAANHSSYHVVSRLDPEGEKQTHCTDFLWVNVFKAVGLSSPPVYLKSQVQTFLLVEPVATM